MRSVIKCRQPTIQAWRLGDDSPMERKLIREGKLRCLPSGQYEVFSQEVQGPRGQLACAGDYFKVDRAGFPYPNEKAWFEANHIHLGGAEYRQIPRPLEAWLLGDPVNGVIRFLMQNRGLQIFPDRETDCFQADLWGSRLTAAADAVLVIYGLERDAAGQILDVNFNFVARKEFDQTYCFCRGEEP